METWTVHNAAELAQVWDKAKDGDVIILLLAHKSDFEVEVKVDRSEWSGCAC